MLKTIEAPENSLIRIKASPPEMWQDQQLMSAVHFQSQEQDCTYMFRPFILKYVRR